MADQLHHIQQIKSSSDAFVALRDDAKLICGCVEERGNHGETTGKPWESWEKMGKSGKSRET